MLVIFDCDGVLVDTEKSEPSGPDRGPPSLRDRLNRGRGDQSVPWALKRRNLGESPSPLGDASRGHLHSNT